MRRTLGLVGLTVLLLVSPAFAGKSRVARHRLVNELLAVELATRVHALAIRAYAPGEAVR